MAVSRQTTPSDIPLDHWTQRLAPRAVRPYLRLMRLERPIGTWLLLFPGWWAIAMASPTKLPDFHLIVLFGLGAVVMRGAGCVVNDIVDRDIDGQISRTAARPIPAGEVSLGQAAALLALLLGLGLAILLGLNRPTIELGIFSLLLVASYPFMKRITWWPQAFLGLTFNFGALMGWTAASGALAPAAFLLYAGGIAWTLGYDTIYAHQDRQDDALVGVRSTARLFGQSSRAWISGFYLTAVVLFLLAGLADGLGLIYALAIGLAALQFRWQVRTLDVDSTADCLAKFRSNRFIGWIVLGGTVLAHAWS